ncbi:SAFB-like transcription modulator isoform X2 [Adelges cooleyi]|uniref:SAFB-like transcription modulator isoform X2 n=1 Tax=Adelges cooleyi TaxID=133065 RepID=UPI0021808225|nr:SAFB-like transcription modulator isoform X2 [Adelges cooleyi]
MSENSALESPTSGQNDGTTAINKRKKCTPSKTVKQRIAGRRGRPGLRSKRKQEDTKTEQADDTIVAVAAETEPLTELIANADVQECGELKSKDPNDDVAVSDETDLSEAANNEDEEKELECEKGEHLITTTSSDFDENNTVERNGNETFVAKCNSDNDDDCILDEELDHEVYVEDIKNGTGVFDEINNDFENCIDETSKDDVEDTINLALGDDDMKLFTDEEEDSDTSKEDEVNEGQVSDEETRPPVTVDSESDSDKETDSTSREATEHECRGRSTAKRLFDADKLQRSHQGVDDTDSNNDDDEPSVVKVDNKDKTKQVGDKADADDKQSNDSRSQSPSNDLSKINASVVRSVWVSNLSSNTKATDLMKLFSTYGKVVSAKVMINPKTPGDRCYGYVTLSSAEEVDLVIERLNRTELNGHVVTVEKVKQENGKCTASADDTKENEDCAEGSDRECKKHDDRREEKKQTIAVDGGDKKTEALNDSKRSSSTDTKPESKRSKIVNNKRDRLSRDRSVTSKINDRERQRLKEIEREKEHLERMKKKRLELLRYTKIKIERERQKHKAHENALREEKERQMNIDRKQKEEFIRLAKERQQLQIERELIEKEKAKLLGLERENQRLERERLQREKEELLRAQEKLKAAKLEASLSSSLKRAVEPSTTATSDKKQMFAASTSRDERLHSSRSRPNEKFVNPTVALPLNIPTFTHYYDTYPSESRRSRPSPSPPPPPASRPKDSAVSARYGVPSSSDHRYKSRDGQSDRRDDSRRKETSSRHGHTSHESGKSSYTMSRSNDNNAWSSLPPPPVNGSLFEATEQHSRPDPWLTSSGGHSENDNLAWQHPPQPSSSVNRWNSTSAMCGRISGNNVVYDHRTVPPPSVGMNVLAADKHNRYGSYKTNGVSRKY